MGARTTKCKSPRVSKGDTLNVEHITLTDARVFARMPAPQVAETRLRNRGGANGLRGGVTDQKNEVLLVYHPISRNVCHASYPGGEPITLDFQSAMK